MHDKAGCASRRRQPAAASTLRGHPGHVRGHSARQHRYEQNVLWRPLYPNLSWYLQSVFKKYRGFIPKKATVTGLASECESIAAEVFVRCYCNVVALVAKAEVSAWCSSFCSNAQGQWQVATLKMNDFVF